MTRRKLTEKQQRFVEAYTGVSKANATDAARRAGYAGGERALAVRGSELLRNRKVLSAIEAATAEVRQAAIMTREERQRFFSAIARGAETHEPHVTQTGEVVRTEPPHAARLRAAELLGKMQGDFVDRLDVRMVDVLEEVLDKLHARFCPACQQALLEAIEEEGES